MSTVEAELLAANQAFYEAFARSDLETIDAMWAERAPVACIHPGWDALLGRDDVLASWRAILDGGSSVSIRCLHPSAHVVGEIAYVICGESISDTELIATNIFIREDGHWKLIHHQAGPVHRRTKQRPQPKRSGFIN